MNMRFLIDKTTHLFSLLRKRQRVSVQLPVLKANLGAGLAIAPGWVNVDGSLNALIANLPKWIHKIAYRLSGSNRYYTESQYCSLLGDNIFFHYDLCFGAPFEDNSVDYFYSSHFWEHLHRSEAEHLTRETYRALKPGGRIRIAVPDLDHALSLFKSGEVTKALDNYFFVEDKDSYFARHKYMYDFNLLTQLLTRCGFKNIERYEFKKGKVPDLDLLDNRPEETLFVEATK